MEVQPNSALERAVSVAGSQAKLAALVGVSQPAISKALAAGRCTAEMAVEIERATGVSRKELRPDLWPSHLPEPEKQEAVS